MPPAAALSARFVHSVSRVPKIGRFYYWRALHGEPASEHIVLVISSPPQAFGDVMVLRTTGFTQNGRRRYICDALPEFETRRACYIPLGNTPAVFTNPLLAQLKTTKPSTFGSPAYLLATQAYCANANDLEPCASDRAPSGPVTQLTPAELERVRSVFIHVLYGGVPSPQFARVTRPPSSGGPSQGRPPLLTATDVGAPTDGATDGSAGTAQEASQARSTWAAIVRGATEDAAFGDADRNPPRDEAHEAFTAGMARAQWVGYHLEQAHVRENVLIQDRLNVGQSDEESIDSLEDFDAVMDAFRAELVDFSEQEDDADATITRERVPTSVHA